MNFNTVLYVLMLLALTTTCRGLACEKGHPQLEIAVSEAGKAYLTYGDAPLLAFGPADEMRIVSGAADVARWALWQEQHGMNLIRAYPTSVPLEVYGETGLHPFQRHEDKWDVDAFNEEYFEYLGKAAAAMEERGIILHLQLWQIVFFKGGDTRWNANYLNPSNNSNEWTRALSRGRDYIDAAEDTPARKHQRRWVRAILDVLKGRGNIIIDVINELGNEMGTLEWAVEVTRWIRAWETENDWTFIVGVDSEHHYTPDSFGAYRDHFDIIILNELRSREYALNTIAAFGMPAVSVRSSDGRNQWHDYMFARADQTGPEHQTRYRTLCYRSIFAGLQAIGAYWKPMVQDADYRDMEYWPRYAIALREFWNRVAPHWPDLVPDTEDAHILDAVTPYAYALTSPELVLVYLDCGSHTWNNTYPESTLALHVPFIPSSIVYFEPRSGDSTSVEGVRNDTILHISLPSFVDDAVVFVER